MTTFQEPTIPQMPSAMRPPLDMRLLGQRIASARGQRRLTQQTLAWRSGVSSITISQLERGKNPRPGLMTILALSTAMEMTVDELLHLPLPESRAPAAETQ